MNKVTALLLRRMRTPLLVVIATYAFSVLGLVLMPGINDKGQPWHLDFFHAFYFVSYMATTIGFGEIPYQFTPAQRLWTVVCIYVGVVAWFYALGTIISLMQDRAFRLALAESRFARTVRGLREPFYLVCGYGDTGGLLVQSLSERGVRSVVIDVDPSRVDALSVENLGVYVPGLSMDAGVPQHLIDGGLQHPRCAGVLALTDQDQVNLHIAITAKLINPNLTVICRAESHDATANMASFGTEHIVNPFEAFAGHLAMALHSPDLHVIYEWLTGVPRSYLSPVIYPPHGTWVLCGYGRFGKAVKRHLEYEGIRSVVVEADPQKTGCDDCVVGRGTEAVTLREARIEKAVGIVAGTDDDANNLSILMTARELNPNLFFVGRQNKRFNDAIFQAAHADLVMQRSQIISQEILALIMNPMLSAFLRHARHQNRDWAERLVERLGEVVGAVVPDIWSATVSIAGAPAVTAALAEGLVVRLEHLVQDNRDRREALACIALMLRRGGKDTLLPAAETPLMEGDELLFCGRWHLAGRMDWTLQNLNALSYIITGEDRPTGYIWQWLVGRGA